MDMRIALCNAAGSLLQGGPTKIYGKTFVGDATRKKERRLFIK